MEDAELALAGLEEVALATLAAPLLEEEKRPDPSEVDSMSARWLELRRSSNSGFRPLRLQPVLLHLLEIIRANRVETLNRWQSHLLIRAFKLAEALGTGPAALFREAIRPHLDSLQMLRDHHGPLLDTRQINPGLIYVSAAEIAKCRPREIKMVAGVDMSFVGPVFSHSGPVKVLDSVPDTGTVVVEGGSCYINGYVFGRVVASEACHVGRNITGTVLVRTGKVTSDGILRRAFVVTKNGAVECRVTEDPALVFAGMGIDVVERTYMGTYASPRIQIGEEAGGGRYAVSDSLMAPVFRNDQDRPLSVFLQRALMPEDYGEVLGHDARRMTIQWVKLRQRLLSAEQMVAATEEEIERTAASAISYLLGGEVVRKELEEVRQMERRLIFLERLINGLNTVNDSVEARATGGLGGEENDDVDSDWDEVTDDWGDLDDESDVEPAWVEEKQEFQQFTTAVQRAALPPKAREALFRWNEKKLSWVRERNSLLSSLERKRSELRRIMGRAEAVASLDLKMSKQRQLALMLESLREKRGQENWSERAGSVFMRVLLRNMASLRSRADHYGKVIPGMKDNLNSLSDRLRNEFSIRLNIDDSRLPPKVTGKFEKGVRIFAKRYREPESPEDVYVTTSASSSTTLTYVREGNSVMEATEILGDQDMRATMS